MREDAQKSTYRISIRHNLTESINAQHLISYVRKAVRYIMMNQILNLEDRDPRSNYQLSYMI